MGRKFPPGTLCVYCAEEKATTIDHVPPRCLFAKENRQKLVRVPSCKGCNNRFSSDDEFFRHVLPLRKDVFDLPEAQESRDAMLRALDREDHRGLRQATARQSLLAEKWYGGFYLGLQRYFTYSTWRTNRVASRVIYGLWWEAFQQRLPNDYLCFALEANIFQNAGVPEEHYLVDIPSARVRTFLDRDRVCFIAAEQNSHDPFTTRWFLGFYGKLFFAGFTLPKTGIKEEVLSYLGKLDYREAQT